MVGAAPTRQVAGAVGRHHRVGVEQLGHVVAGIAPEQVGGLAVDAVAARPAASSRWRAARRPPAATPPCPRPRGGPGGRRAGRPARRRRGGDRRGSRRGRSRSRGAAGPRARPRGPRAAGRGRPRGRPTGRRAPRRRAPPRGRPRSRRGRRAPAGRAGRPPRGRRSSARSGRAAARPRPARRPTAGSGSADSMRSISPSTSIHSRARSWATRSGSPTRVSSSNAASASRTGQLSSIGASMRATSSARSCRTWSRVPARAAAACSMTRTASLASAWAASVSRRSWPRRLELAAQRGLVELGRLEVAQLAGRVVDHLGGGVALLLDEHQLGVRRLDVGAAGVEVPPGVLGRVGELAGTLEQAVAVLEVGRHAPGPGGGLVAAVRGDGLQLAGATQAGRQLAAHPLVVLDPADGRLRARRGEVVGPERDAEASSGRRAGRGPCSRASRSASSARSAGAAGRTVIRPCRPGSSPVMLMWVDVVSVVLDALTGGVLPSQQTASSPDPPGSVVTTVALQGVSRVRVLTRASEPRARCRAATHGR